MKSVIALLCFCILSACEKPHNSIFDHKSFTLENGLKVYLIENTLTPLVDVKVFYKVGTADDARAEHGLSHFLEHLMFKGTEKFPKNAYDQIMSRQGAQYNAFTTPDFTAYTTTLSADQLELVFLLEADRMKNLNFTKEDVKSEREVVHEERAMRLDNNPFGQSQEEYLRALYGNHPYGIPPIGYKEHISAYTYESAMAHYKKYYHPGNAFIVVTGNVKLEQVKALAEKYFAAIPKGEIITRKRIEERPTSSNTTIKYKAPRINLTYVHMSYHAPNFKSEGHEHGIPLLILAQIIGGNELSRFHTQFVEGEKIAANVTAGYDYTSFDPQDFSFGMTVIPGTTYQVATQKMQEAIKRIVNEGITEKELIQAKRDMNAEFAFVKDGVDQPSKYFAALAIEYKVEDIEHWDKKINGVTLEQVNAAAKYLLSNDPAVTLILLPQKS